MKAHWLFVLFAACNSADDSSDGETDGDGDGFTTADDCDDAQASVHPGADEVAADGVDQDCDGNDLCYLDGDGDGFGSTTTVAAPSCDGAGAADDDDDCDDADAAFHPGAKESCEEAIDYNCDGAVAYVDGDADGWAACVDCDDKNKALHPEGEEVVADGIDQDCDAGDSCYVDADGDGFGVATVVASTDLDCADAGESAEQTDCLDTGDGAAVTFPGAASSESTTDCMTDADDDGYGFNSPSTGVTAGGDCDDTDSTVTCDVIHVGFDVELPDISHNTNGYLFGQPVDVKTAMTVTDIGIITKEGGTNVRVALYDDSGADFPVSPIAESDITATVLGDQAIPVLKSVALKPGTYWIMAVFDVTTDMGTDYTCPMLSAYCKLDIASPLPDPFKGMSYTDNCLNYYLIGF